MHTGVARCLFGRPDHKKLEKWLTKELQAIQKERVKIYAFDFKGDQPIASTASTKYVFEAIPENEVPQFYRTTYYPSKEGRKRRVMPPPPFLSVDCVKEKLEDIGDVVAYHTRSHDGATAKTTNIILPKIPKNRASSTSQSGRHTKTQRPPALKTRSLRKHLQTSGARKKPMKQSLLTSYLPVVRKRRVLTCTQAESSSSSKLRDGSPIRMNCLDAKALNIDNTGVRTRWQSRNCTGPTAKRLRSAY